MDVGIHVGTRIGTAAAFAAVGVKHLIVHPQQPTIEATLDVRQRFAEDGTWNSS